MKTSKLVVNSTQQIVNRIIIDGAFTPQPGFTLRDENGQDIGNTYVINYIPPSSFPLTPSPS